jgi:hypothetical protein
MQLCRYAATIVVAACFLSACGSDKPGEVQVVEVVEGKPVDNTASTTKMTEVQPPRAAVRAESLSSAERVSSHVGSVARTLAENHELHLARALEPDPPDMAHGSAVATPAR